MVETLFVGKLYAKLYILDVDESIFSSPDIFVCSVHNTRH